MQSRLLVSLFAVMGSLVFHGIASAQGGGGLRTVWGDPDLQSVWDYRTVTPLERPADQPDKAFLTEEEAASIEQDILNRNADLLTRAPERTSASSQVDRREDGSPGFYNNFWLDRGTTAVGTRRTSLIVDPPNGRLPALTPEARRLADSDEAARVADVRRGDRPAQSYTDLDAGDRCIQHAKAGPPISVGGYNNNVQIFQIPGYVALLNEQNHDVRIIPLDGRPHINGRIAQWMGDSRGRWEGDTLIVDTLHFNGKHDQIARPLLSSGDDLTLIERFTRTDEDTLMYEFTVSDPTIWASPWSVEHPMKRNPDLIYEFACHEGNYGMHNIMAGSRQEEREARGDASEK